jgi:hypothetical protein
MFDKLIGIITGKPHANDREERRLDAIHGPERKPRFPGALAKRLLRYPVNTPLHPGAQSALSEEQVDANLAAFLTRKAERFAHFASLLKEFGVDIAPLLDPTEDPVPVIDAIEQWMLDYLPERKDLPPHDSIVNAPYERMWASDRAGPDIVFTLAADYAVALGETLAVRRPKLSWGVDRTALSNPKHKGGGRYTWRRIVILAERQKGWSDTPMFAAEDTALHAIYWLRSRSADKPQTSWRIRNWLDSPMS